MQDYEAPRTPENRCETAAICFCSENVRLLREIEEHQEAEDIREVSCGKPTALGDFQFDGWVKL